MNLKKKYQHNLSNVWIQVQLLIAQKGNDPDYKGRYFEQAFSQMHPSERHIDN